MAKHHGRRRALAGVAVLVAVGVASGCGGPEADAATWVVARHQHLDEDTTSFTAVVTRLGCSSGEQGEPQPPEVEYGDTEVEITITISPHVESGDCIGTPGVAFEIELREPLGDRSLVDGACGPDDGSGASTTSFCLKDGVRYRPD